MTRINTNISSLNAQKTLLRSNTQLQTALTRLSTGLRINVGKDDPAGLIASEILRSDIVSTQRAITNSERANQLIATADSALGQVSSLLNDIRSLVTEAANTGALSVEQIQANQLQIDSSLESIDRIARVTSFQGRRLLDGSLDFLVSSPGATLTTASAQVGALTDANAFGLAGEVSSVNAARTVSGGSANTELNFTFSAGFAGNSAEVVVATGGAASATYVGATRTLTVTRVSATTTANDIIALVSANASAAAVFSVVNATGSTGSGVYSTTGTFALTGGRDRNQLQISAASAGTEFNATVTFTAGGALSATYTSAASGASTLVVTYVSGTSTAANVVSAINATTRFNATLASGTATTAQFTNVDTGGLAGGVNGNQFLISAATAGSQFANARLEFTSGAVAGSEAASYNSATRTITVQIADGSSTASQIVSAINADLSGTFTASLQSGSNGVGALAVSGSSATFSGGTSVAKVSNLNIDQANFGTQNNIDVNVQIDRQATRAALRYSGGTLSNALVLEVGGKDGFEVFNFGSGTTIDRIATALNTNSDATGVQATVSGAVLELSSSDYGSKSFISVRTLNNNAGGSFDTFDSGGASFSRITGTDVVARINGISARGEGLKASLNTATLDLDFDVSSLLVDGDSVSFGIDGGGANFQLGPDVVSNQQARLGLQGVNSATLGGLSGTLFELRSGGSKTLALSPTGAAKVVDEVITKVTQLRGRLGAFQKTTLETSIFTLNDTLEALTDAEASIRDADFAAESARLTRAQILVQSGTSVLAIANQNPQNVLALLR